MSNTMWHVALEPGTSRMQDVILADLRVDDLKLYVTCFQRIT